MDNILQIVRQEKIEQTFNRKHIDKKIREAIESNPLMVAKIEEGVSLVQDYCSKTYYASKNARVAQVAKLDHTELITNIFVGIAYFPVHTLFTSVTAQLASRLGFDDKREAIMTVAELLAILCDTDAFDIVKADRLASLHVISRIPLEKELVEFIINSAYLPPMVCEPIELKSNYCSGYLSHKDSVILGPGNHHEGDVCLDVLNTMNRVALKLDTEFLCTLDEMPNHELDTAEKRDQWAAFKVQSLRFYKIMVDNGNEFYLTHKVDKRGRAYSQGYHITTQGSPYKKAMLELANEELVDGAPPSS